MSATPITSVEQFHEVISGSQPALVAFWMVWNEPWRKMNPSFETMSKDAENSAVAFHTVEIGDHQDITEEAGITVIPTFMLYKDGVQIDGFQGAMPDNVKKLIQQGKEL
ncbi:thioredoxin family protein [Streptomyces sp. CA-146814]|uniref:thioredoxin family protein n=1 Tax=Streptomyces sp. CA-146814 TaxID=3240053 RepID=UPI003D92331B